jgi:hypothetical protein
MRPRRPEQLALPGTLIEVVQVREELVRVDFALAEMTAELDQARKEIAHLRDKLHQADARAHQAERKMSTLQLQIAELTLRCTQLVLQSSSANETGLDASTLRRLLALCHPDKWSQGQPATTLAHELTVHLNALRKQREPSP